MSEYRTLKDYECLSRVAELESELAKVRDESKWIRRKLSGLFPEIKEGSPAHEVYGCMHVVCYSYESYKSHLPLCDKERKELREKLAAAEQQVVEISIAADEDSRRAIEYDMKARVAGQQLTAAREALRRFIPVLIWLECCEEDTVGRDLGKQLRPIMEKALSSPATDSAPSPDEE